MTKKQASDWEEVRSLQQVFKVKIDGAPRKREATLGLAVWQATLRLALRAGFLEKREKWRNPQLFQAILKTNPRHTSSLKWPTRRFTAWSSKPSVRGSPVNERNGDFTSAMSGCLFQFDSQSAEFKSKTKTRAIAYGTSNTNRPAWCSELDFHQLAGLQVDSSVELHACAA